MNYETIIIEILSRLQLASLIDITIMSGLKDKSYCRKLIKRLIQDGYIRSHKSFSGTHLLYSLTGTALKHCHIRRKPYEFRNQNTYHEEMLAHACAYLYIVADISIYDLEINSTHSSRSNEKPDIVYSNGTKAIEVELTLKEQSRLDDKFSKLSCDYKFIRWIYPSERKSIAKRLELLAEKYGKSKQNCRFTTVNHMLDVINKYDLKSNSPRFDYKETICE